MRDYCPVVVMKQLKFFQCKLKLYFIEHSHKKNFVFLVKITFKAFLKLVYYCKSIFTLFTFAFWTLQFKCVSVCLSVENNSKSQLYFTIQECVKNNVINKRLFMFYGFGLGSWSSNPMHFLLSFSYFLLVRLQKCY